MVVFEPFDENSQNHTIQSVEKIEQNGVFKGVQVRSKASGKELVQYVLVQAKNEQYTDENLGILFKGSFAVITENLAGKLQNIYIGEGEELRYGEIVIRPPNNKKSVYQAF